MYASSTILEQLNNIRNAPRPNRASPKAEMMNENNLWVHDDAPHKLKNDSRVVAYTGAHNVIQRSRAG